MNFETKKMEKVNIKNMENIEEVANFILDPISSNLNLGKKVLLFVTGGSSIAVGVKISEIIKNKNLNNLKNLTIMLTDERYGEVSHKDSNYFNLLDKGFNISGAKVIPVLNGDSFEKTVSDFNSNLEEELAMADYKIGLFGVGADGHTAGILPNSESAYSPQFACGYKGPDFLRITMTFNSISKLDKAVACILGESKWGVVESLRDKDIPKEEQPSQALKEVPSFTIFTDYKNS